jgi:hypothetical protein
MMKGGASTCNPSFPETGHFDQGAQFMKMTASFHGGSRKSKRTSKRKMRSTRRMRGGAFFTPFAEYQTAFDAQLPAELTELAKTAPLDAKFAELPAIERAAGVMAGGGRSRKNKRNMRRTRKYGGRANINAPTMILQTAAEETAARLNPQWYTENTVIPGFRGPIPVPGSEPVPAPMPPKTGGRRKSRKSNRRHRRR